MRIKTIVVILITIIFTIVLIQNNDPVYFSFLWATFRISKLVMMTGVSVIAFILGVLVGRPNKVKRLGPTFTNNDIDKTQPDTLSDEDRDYIS